MSWSNRHLKILREDYLLGDITPAESIAFFKLTLGDAVAFLRARCGCPTCRSSKGTSFEPHGRGTFSAILKASITDNRRTAGQQERSRRSTLPD